MISSQTILSHIIVTQHHLVCDQPFALAHPEFIASAEGRLSFRRRSIVFEGKSFAGADRCNLFEPVVMGAFSTCLHAQQQGRSDSTTMQGFEEHGGAEAMRPASFVQCEYVC